MRREYKQIKAMYSDFKTTQNEGFQKMVQRLKNEKAMQEQRSDEIMKRFERSKQLLDQNTQENKHNVMLK